MADFQAMIKTELIGKDLMAAVQKMNGATCYAIMPKTLKDDSGLGLDEAIEQIAEFVQGITKSDKPPFNAEDIQGELKAFVDISKVRLVLRQAYLFIQKHSEETEKEKDVTEYAFNIAVLMNDGEFEQAEASLFKVKELSFAVWSCDRQMILDTMDILDLTDIDKAIENAAKLEEKKKAAVLIAQKDEQDEKAGESEEEKPKEEEPEEEKPEETGDK